MSEITNAIVKHIFTNLGLFGTVEVSAVHSAFLTAKTIDYQNENEDNLTAPIYACETSIEGKKFSIVSSSLPILEDVEMDSGLELFAIMKLEGSPTFGCYIQYYPDTQRFYDGLVGTEIKLKSWIPANIYLQATYLAGMEQLKDLIGLYQKSENLEMITLLKDFIAFVEKREN